MIPRLLPAVLVLVAAAAPDPEAEALSWSPRPRQEIVDGLAEGLLPGGPAAWYEPAKGLPQPPEPPSRIPADFDPAGVPVTDRLAARVPADAAVAFFESLAAAEAQAGVPAELFPRAPEALLLPPIWRANPGVRTGTRQVAIVASDPDFRGAPDVALLCEVDDATLVRTHRRATFSWEDRSPRRLIVEGLDAWTEDGAVRSFFALEGGIAVWSTTRSLRDRILAASAGRAPSLLGPDRRAWAFARKSFPAAEGGALLVVPDAFLRRNGSWETRAKRAASLRCEAARRGTGARCPAGGTFAPGPGGTGATCSVHGTPSSPVPLGDLPAAVPCAADARGAGDAFPGGPWPAAALVRAGVLEAVPAGPVPGGSR